MSSATKVFTYRLAGTLIEKSQLSPRIRVKPRCWGYLPIPKYLCKERRSGAFRASWFIRIYSYAPKKFASPHPRAVMPSQDRTLKPAYGKSLHIPEQGRSWCCYDYVATVVVGRSLLWVPADRGRCMKWWKMRRSAQRSRSLLECWYVIIISCTNIICYVVLCFSVARRSMLARPYFPCMG
ncbi:hypothetical protein BC827DRAFT_327222 [Russula dissimulans]|nr:hypothetical protein BC827DRAFT_327222 [Russula dissimulans]